MKKTKKICYNCVYGGAKFNLKYTTAGTHLHCKNQEIYPEKEMEKGDISPWDTLREWWDTCDKFKPK